MTVKTLAPQFRGIYVPRDDAAIFKGREVPAHCKLERRIVWNLLKHLAANGWNPASVYDGEEWLETKTPEAAMDAIFSVDDSNLRVASPSSEFWHSIVLIGGNGADVICDWTYTEDDNDGFGAVMEAFDPYQYE